MAGLEQTAVASLKPLSSVELEVRSFWTPSQGLDEKKVNAYLNSSQVLGSAESDAFRLAVSDALSELSSGTQPEELVGRLRSSLETLRTSNPYARAMDAANKVVDLLIPELQSLALIRLDKLNASLGNFPKKEAILQTLRPVVEKLSYPHPSALSPDEFKKLYQDLDKIVKSSGRKTVYDGDQLVGRWNHFRDEDQIPDSVREQGERRLKIEELKGLTEFIRELRNRSDELMLRENKNNGGAAGVSTPNQSSPQSGNAASPKTATTVEGSDPLDLAGAEGPGVINPGAATNPAGSNPAAPQNKDDTKTQEAASTNAPKDPPTEGKADIKTQSANSAAVEKALQGILEALNKIEKRIDSIEGQIKEVKEQIDLLRKDIQQLSGRVPNTPPAPNTGAGQATAGGAGSANQQAPSSSGAQAPGSGPAAGTAGSQAGPNQPPPTQGAQTGSASAAPNPGTSSAGGANTGQAGAPTSKFSPKQEAAIAAAKILGGDSLKAYLNPERVQTDQMTFEEFISQVSKVLSARGVKLSTNLPQTDWLSAIEQRGDVFELRFINSNTGFTPGKDQFSDQLILRIAQVDSGNLKARKKSLCEALYDIVMGDVERGFAKLCSQTDGGTDWTVDDKYSAKETLRMVDENGDRRGVEEVFTRLTKSRAGTSGISKNVKFSERYVGGDGDHACAILNGRQSVFMDVSGQTLAPTLLKSEVISQAYICIDPFYTGTLRIQTEPTASGNSKFSLGIKLGKKPDLDALHPQQRSELEKLGARLRNCDVTALKAELFDGIDDIDLPKVKALDERYCRQVLLLNQKIQAKPSDRGKSLEEIVPDKNQLENELREISHDAVASFQAALENTGPVKHTYQRPTLASSLGDQYYRRVLLQERKIEEDASNCGKTLEQIFASNNEELKKELLTIDAQKVSELRNTLEKEELIERILLRDTNRALINTVIRHLARYNENQIYRKDNNGIVDADPLSVPLVGYLIPEQAVVGSKAKVSGPANYTIQISPKGSAFIRGFHTLTKEKGQLDWLQHNGYNVK